jgi:hypothetical protein
MSYAIQSLSNVAQEVAGALIRLTEKDANIARLALPLLYPGGAMVNVEISILRDGFLVTDAGGARREAEMMGGEKTFMRIAGDIADRYGVRFDHHMIFDLEVLQPEVIAAVISVANAAKSAVETTAMHLASTEHADYRAYLWSRLERLHEPSRVFRNRSVRGSSDEWRFDAVVQVHHQLTLFEIIAPHPNAVSSAVTKFLDIRDLGEAAPRRFAVVTDLKETPHLSVLARTARVVSISDPDDAFRQAA